MGYISKVCQISSSDGLPICEPAGGCPAGYSGQSCEIRCDFMLQGSCFWIVAVCIKKVQCN